MNQIKDREALARAAQRGVGDDVDLWPRIRAGVLTARRRGPDRRVAYTVAALTVLAALAVVVTLLSLPAQPVSAEAIVGKAQAAMTEPGAVHTYHLREVTSYPAKAGYQIATEVWYDAKAGQRTRIETPVGGGSFDVEEYVSNGSAGWIAATHAGRTTVVQTALPKMAQQAEALGEANSLAGILTAYGTAKWCMNVAAEGEATVAGQPTYIIVLTPRPDGCGVGPGGKTEPEGRPARPNMETRVWVDKRSFLPLKSEMRWPDGSVMQRTEVTEVQYDVNFDPALFVYSPPAGATVTGYDGSPDQNIKALLNGGTEDPAPAKKP